jgi:hypothetical protein
MFVPYREISDLLRQGKVIPFIGAGANLGNRPPGARWNENTTSFLPKGDELSNWLAAIISFPPDEPSDDLAKVASYFAVESGRTRLIERLQTVFHKREYMPCDIHYLLAELAKSAELAPGVDASVLPEFNLSGAEEAKPLLIVTTNYDVLTEIALQDLGCSYDLVVHPTDNIERAGSVMWWKHGADKPEWVRPNELPIDLNTTTVVYKMHGSGFHAKGAIDSYVITEDDYIDFLSLMMSQQAIPKLFMSHFYTRQFLFLGYGLRDWNFRVMLKNLTGKAELISPSPQPETEQSALAEGTREGSNQLRPELTSWAIQKDPSHLETRLWFKRDVSLFPEDINLFVEGIRRHCKSLVCHLNSKRIIPNGT